MTEFRITELGDFRITEALDSRILEKFGPTLNGVSSITIKSRAKYKNKFQSLATSSERYTESGDLRLTQNGDTRVTELLSGNAGSSSIIIFGNKITFDAELFVKYLSNWKIGIPYVKYLNQWIQPIAIYKHTEGTWERVD